MSNTPKHPDFTAVETNWGIHYLHKSNTVWYVYYELMTRKTPGLFSKPKTGGWVAYHTSQDFPSNTPWCQDSIKLGVDNGVDTEEEAIKLCLDRVKLKLSLTNGTFQYT